MSVRDEFTPMTADSKSPDPNAGSRADEIAQLRHDLKNHLTALRSGCALVLRHLEAGDVEKVRTYLAQMQKEVTEGFETVARVR